MGLQDLLRRGAKLTQYKLLWKKTVGAAGQRSDTPLLIESSFPSTVQPLHTGPCANRNPVYTVIIIWSRINYTQNNTN